MTPEPVPPFMPGQMIEHTQTQHGMPYSLTYNRLTGQFREQYTGAYPELPNMCPVVLLEIITPIKIESWIIRFLLPEGLIGYTTYNPDYGWRLARP